MSQVKLAAAKEFIQERNFSVARVILQSLPHDPTAVHWLARLNEIDKSAPMKFPEPPPKPISYEYKQVKIVWTFNHDAAMNNKIREMEAQGWEFVDFHDDGRPNAFGVYTTSARLVRFRRPRA